MQTVFLLTVGPKPAHSAQDIQKQLPAEAKAFIFVDRQFKDIMRKAKDRPNAMQVWAQGLHTQGIGMGETPCLQGIGCAQLKLRRVVYFQLAPCAAAGYVQRAGALH